MQDILERFAFDNICKVAFNVDPACLGGDGTSGGEFMRAFEDAATLSSGRFIDIVISFILAGRDTTSSALSWFFWLLSLNPDVERNILKELETIRSSNGKNLGDTYSFEELRDMHYLQAAISETLIRTECTGKRVHSSFLYSMMGQECVWGKTWMKSIAASVIERFEIDVQNKENCPEHLLSLTLRMKGGLQVKVTGR
ncbi:hypothetical protein NC653_035927 [Populus alba x Populus x berolinensis]|uniref:Cytochrome P450 n=1 Tax=Populus alba x Populus x berolinensis TaxID=444605 RepID=A0AAD6LIL0_9ROSI|nr:hypothetical protein NC653_035927 [Populus alba x Populus x berolinensis]